MRFLLLLLKRRLSKSLKSRGALSCGARWISRSSQLAKLSKRVEALAKEHTEVAEKVVAKQTELAQLEVELEEARRLIMQPTPPPTPPPSQGPRGHSSPRSQTSSGGATGEEAPSLQQVLAAQETFSMQELESVMESFRQRHSLLEQEMIANEQRELEDALGWSG